MTDIASIQEKPGPIQRAVILLWITFAQIAILILFTRLSPDIDEGMEYGLVFDSALLGLLAVLIPNLSAGRNWARVILAVFAFLGILMDLANFSAILREGMLVMILNLIGDISLVAAVFLVLTKPGSDWFAQHRQSGLPVRHRD